jgi:hypothetical protein
MKKFITDVSMKITEENYHEGLRLDIANLGYDTQFVYELDEYPYIRTDTKCSCIRTCKSRTGSTSLKKLEDYSYLIEGYNPELFLALAAMTEGEDPIIGEYFKCLKEIELNSDGYKYSEGEIVQVLFYNNDYDNDLHSKNSFGKHYDRNYYRKATKEELIEHFRKEKISDSDTSCTDGLFVLTREEMKKIYDKCSLDKKQVIEIILSGQKFENKVNVTSDFLFSVIKDLIF